METIATILNYVLAFLIAYFLALWVALAIWAFYDIRTRTNDILVQLFSVLLVLAFNVFGLILYLFLRPQRDFVRGERAGTRGRKLSGRERVLVEVPQLPAPHRERLQGLPDVPARA